MSYAMLAVEKMLAAWVAAHKCGSSVFAVKASVGPYGEFHAECPCGKTLDVGVSDEEKERTDFILRRAEIAGDAIRKSLENMVLGAILKEPPE